VIIAAAKVKIVDARNVTRVWPALPLNCAVPSQKVFNFSNLLPGREIDASYLLMNEFDIYCKRSSSDFSKSENTRVVLLGNR